LESENVNDRLLIGNNSDEMNKILKKLGEEFKMKITKHLKAFNGYAVTTYKDSVVLLQRDYIKKILY